MEWEKLKKWDGNRDGNRDGNGDGDIIVIIDNLKLYHCDVIKSKWSIILNQITLDT